MKHIKSILSLVVVIQFFSCGKKDEEYIDEKHVEKQTNQSEKKDTSKQNIQLQNTDKKNSSENKSNFELKPEKIITPLEASDNIGKVVTVKGFIAEVYKKENVEYLNFMEKYPDNPFEGVIFQKKFDEFGDINIYNNKNVEITGLVSSFKGKPQIILNSKDQIKISK
jgi:DNA/RNA endonuclease YhcR with UshA esterase domain